MLQLTQRQEEREISPSPTSLLFRPQQLRDTICTRITLPASLDPNSDATLHVMPPDIGSRVTGKLTLIKATLAMALDTVLGCGLVPSNT